VSHILCISPFSSILSKSLQVCWGPKSKLNCGKHVICQKLQWNQILNESARFQKFHFSYWKINFDSFSSVTICVTAECTELFVSAWNWNSEKKSYKIISIIKADLPHPVYSFVYCITIHCQIADMAKVRPSNLFLRPLELFVIWKW